MGRVVGLELADETQVQVAPFAHHLLMVVSMVPSMQSVLCGYLLLVLCCIEQVGCFTGREITLESIEDRRNMIVELSARERRSIGESPISFYLVAPGRQYAITSLVEMRSKRNELIV